MSTTPSVQQLRRQYRQLRNLHMLSGVLAVLALALYFTNPRLTLVVLVLSLVLNLTVTRNWSKAYTKNFVHLAAQLTLEKHLEKAWHDHNPVLTEAQVRQARMLPCNAATGSITLHQGGKGTYQNRPVQLGDVTLAHTFTEGTKKHHNFAVGCWISVELSEDTGLDCRFIGASTTPDQSLKEMLWVETDLKQMPVPTPLISAWKVVCCEKNQTMPNSNFLKQLEKLHQKKDGHLAVCVQGSSLHILLIGDILGQRITNRMEPGPNFEQADLLPCLSSALLLSDLL